MIKALARAHRWKKLLDTKKYDTIKQIAEAEKVTSEEEAARTVGQILRLTLPAPDIIETILDGRLPNAPEEVAAEVGVVIGRS